MSGGRDGGEPSFKPNFASAEPDSGPCRHLELIDIESLDGELIARLCPTCDRQFYEGSAQDVR